MEWGVCTTAKATVEQTLAFVAWHLDLGASRIWLHLDDPEDPVGDLLIGAEGVTVIHCDAAWWEALGGRPDHHSPRQGLNLRRLYAENRVPWLFHLDVDEFLTGDAPIDELLDTVRTDVPYIRLAPFEALFDSSLEDDIFTATVFRAEVPRNMPRPWLRRMFGAYRDVLPRGLLGHRAGKCAFLGGKDVRPGIHGPSRSIRTDFPWQPFNEDMRILHFHANDKTDWLAKLPRRVAGGYSTNHPLVEFLGTASEIDIQRFYYQTQTAVPEKVAIARDQGLIHEQRLELRRRIEARFGAPED
ncbi:glycosyltransferase family 2 protein [Pelagovum pacificum]|uniref:Glycosyltransferase family 2 protein n=1 Tax=Pelagovum pacificum TaxID=2588711 RepID=A0A5C5GG42_9RHOB|nr:glycosyltransferase family 2 protein [Pelagovum pacificum]QQA43186.1 glycosyltransferase family 2 protein [Pelagovum pacificum]TNY33673.1 glycosyltransferase family 2 protein [Pelagovum pacificum]